MTSAAITGIENTEADYRKRMFYLFINAAFSGSKEQIKLMEYQAANEYFNKMSIYEKVDLYEQIESNCKNQPNNRYAKAAKVSFFACLANCFRTISTKEGTMYSPGCFGENFANYHLVCGEYRRISKNGPDIEIPAQLHILFTEKIDALEFFKPYFSQKKALKAIQLEITCENLANA